MEQEQSHSISIPWESRAWRDSRRYRKAKYENGETPILSTIRSLASTSVYHNLPQSKKASIFPCILETLAMTVLLSSKHCQQSVRSIRSPRSVNLKPRHKPRRSMTVSRGPLAESSSKAGLITSYGQLHFLVQW